VIRIGLFELIDAFQNILDKVSPEHRVDLTRDRVSVRERIAQLTELLEKQESMTFDELFAKAANDSILSSPFWRFWKWPSSA
jgi:segregation and condensation protein A